MNAHVEVPEDGEPVIAGRRLPVLSVVLQVGGSSQSVEEYADEHGLDVADVTAALSWAATREDWMDRLIEARARSMQEMSEKDYPEDVEPPGFDTEDVADFRRRARRALRSVVSDWRQYGDTRFCEE